MAALFLFVPAASTPFWIAHAFACYSCSATSLKQTDGNYECTSADCKFKLNKYIASHKLQPERPIAILSDGGLPHDWVWEHLKPDIVQPLTVEGQQDYGEDVRGRKLLAYTQSPFEASVFLDGDTYVRSSSVQLLFDALRTFELAAAFECCRVEYGSPNTPYDSRGFFRGQCIVGDRRWGDTVPDFVGLRIDTALITDAHALAGAIRSRLFEPPRRSPMPLWRWWSRLTGGGGGGHGWSGSSDEPQTGAGGRGRQWH